MNEELQRYSNDVCNYFGVKEKAKEVVVEEQVEGAFFLPLFHRLLKCSNDFIPLFLFPLLAFCCMNKIFLCLEQVEKVEGSEAPSDEPVVEVSATPAPIVEEPTSIQVCVLFNCLRNSQGFFVLVLVRYHYQDKKSSRLFQKLLGLLRPI